MPDEKHYTNDTITDDDEPGVAEPVEADEDDPAIDHEPTVEA